MLSKLFTHLIQSSLKTNWLRKFRGSGVIFICVALLFCSNPSLSNHLSADFSTYTFTYSPLEPITINPEQSVWIEKNQQFNLRDFTNGNYESLELAKSDKMLRSGTVVWTIFRLENSGSGTIQAYLKTEIYVDSRTTYVIKNGEITDSINSKLYTPNSKKHISSIDNYIQISLNASESTLYFIRQIASRDLPASRFANVEFIPSAVFLNHKLTTYSLQMFYLGMMMLISFVSMILFVLFREKLYIFCALFVLFLGLYFPKTYGVLDDLFLSALHNNYFYFSQVIISGVLIFGFLFLSNFFGLRKDMPRFYWFYLFVTLSSEIPPHILTIFGVSSTLTAQIHNYFIIAWIVLSVIPIIRFGMKPQLSAKFLLASVVLMTGGAILFVIHLLELFTYKSYLIHTFQIGTLVFSAVLFYELFMRVKIIQNERRMIEEIDGLKTKFFANISHEFRTPLSLMIGPLSHLIEQSETEGDKKLLNMVKRNTKRLLQLINQLLDLSKINSGMMEMHVEKHDIAILLKKISEQFESFASIKEIKFNLISENDIIFLYIDVGNFENIFYNLLSNAFKFTPEKGEITVLIIEKQDVVEIQVRDNGIGISEELQPFIFDYFRQGNHAMETEGSGIGLALAKELVELHGGKITVKSEQGKGTTFIIHFQKGNTHFSAEDLVIHSDENVDVSKQNSLTKIYELTDFNLSVEDAGNVEIELNNNNLPLLLIIDDNDEMRYFIRQCFESGFIILEANGGNEGIESAKKSLPDVIICDLMMPGVDGSEVCKTLKSDTETCHIPIIILTAKAGLNDKVESLKMGVDDFIVKPFEPRELLARVQNLIKSRKQLQSGYLLEAIGKPIHSNGTHAEKEFIDKICSAIDANLENQLFSVEMLAKNVGFSRVHLNRKLKAVYGLSANKFILSYKLQAALKLLKSGESNVSEIAHQTGFSSTSYFVKCFRDKYGKTPGMLLKE